VDGVRINAAVVRLGGVNDYRAPIDQVLEICLWLSGILRGAVRALPAAGVVEPVLRAKSDLILAERADHPFGLQGVVTCRAVIGQGDSKLRNIQSI